MATNQVEIVKLHPDAIIPERKHLTDAGFDLYAVSMKETGNYIEYGTGIAINFEKVMRSPNQLIWADIRPRSSISKYNLILCNSPGTIDMGYNGEILCRFKRVPTPYKDPIYGTWKFTLAPEALNIYQVGDAIAQLVFCYGPLITFTEVKELSFNTSNRGNGSFGSTGR